MPLGTSTPRKGTTSTPRKKASGSTGSSAFLSSGGGNPFGGAAVSPPPTKAQGLDLANHKVTAGRVAPDRNGQSRTQLQLRSKSGLVSLTLEIASVEGTVAAATKEISGVAAAIVELLLRESRKGKKTSVGNDAAAWREMCTALGCPMLTSLYDTVSAADSTRKPRASAPKELPSMPAPMYSFNACGTARGTARGASRSLTPAELAEAREQAVAAERERLERQASYLELPADEQLMVQLETLAAEGKDFDAALDGGLTPLLVTCSMRSLAGVRFCLKHGANPSMWADGKSPLLLAAQQGATELLYVLIQAGADVKAATADEGIAPVHVAAEAGEAAALELLLDFGADADQRDLQGCTPAAYCAQAKTWTSGLSESLRVLLDAGAPPDTYTAEGFSPLLLAIQENHGECVQMLLEAGADSALTEPTTGAAACLLAAQHNAFESCVHLLAAGADPRVSGVCLRVDSYAPTCAAPAPTASSSAAAEVKPADVARLEGFDRLADLLSSHMPQLSREEVAQNVQEKVQRQADRRESFGVWQQTIASLKEVGMTAPKHEALLDQCREAAAEEAAAVEASGQTAPTTASPTHYFGSVPGSSRGVPETSAPLSPAALSPAARPPAARPPASPSQPSSASPPRPASAQHPATAPVPALPLSSSLPPIAPIAVPPTPSDGQSPRFGSDASGGSPSDESFHSSRHMSAAAKAAQRNPVTEGGQWRDPDECKFTYEDLKAHRISDLNANCMEAYLNDEEFCRYCGMEREAFYKLAQWKQRDIRKRLGLF